MSLANRKYTGVAASTLKWWAVLTLVALSSLYLSTPDLPTRGSWWGLLHATASRLWIVFPFIAFAGGLAGSAGERRPGSAATAVTLTVGLLGAMAYVCGAFVAPIAELEADRLIGIRDEVRYPMGAQTPQGLLRQRAVVVERPPATYRFSVDRPLEHPPNWLTYLVHQPLALYVFALLNALLGLLVGWSTTGLSPPQRRHLRWFAGIVTGLIYAAAAAFGTAWVRASPANSGVVAAWLPLSLPLLMLALGLLRRRHRHRPALHTGGSSGV